MKVEEIIKITALVFSKKKTIAQVCSDYKHTTGRELPIKNELENMQSQILLGGVFQW